MVEWLKVKIFGNDNDDVTICRTIWPIGLSAKTMYWYSCPLRAKPFRLFLLLLLFIGFIFYCTYIHIYIHTEWGRDSERERVMAVAAYGQLNLDESPVWGSRSVDCFEKLEQIGEGTYGWASSPSQLLKAVIFFSFYLIILRINRRRHLVFNFMWEEEAAYIHESWIGVWSIFDFYVV